MLCTLLPYPAPSFLSVSLRCATLLYPYTPSSCVLRLRPILFDPTLSSNCPPSDHCCLSWSPSLSLASVKGLLLTV